jgi:hypothetical protein
MTMGYYLFSVHGDLCYLYHPSFIDIVFTFSMPNDPNYSRRIGHGNWESSKYFVEMPVKFMK